MVDDVRDAFLVVNGDCRGFLVSMMGCMLGVVVLLH